MSVETIRFPAEARLKALLYQHPHTQEFHLDNSDLLDRIAARFAKTVGPGQVCGILQESWKLEDFKDGVNEETFIWNFKCNMNLSLEVIACLNGVLEVMLKACAIQESNDAVTSKATPARGCMTRCWERLYQIKGWL